MFSTQAFSVVPFSDSGSDTRVSASLELSSDASFDYAIYVTTRAGYATKPTDTPPNQPFRGVLQSYSFTRSINGGDIGKFATGTGSLVISNDDAHYDFLPVDYSIDARPIQIKLGRVSDSYGAVFPVGRVTATGWNVDTSSIAINLTDYSYKLEVPFQPNVYGGTGGKDGSEDLTGKRCPSCFGYCQNVPAVFLVPSLLIYQVNCGPVHDIVAVRDRGIELTKGDNYSSYALLVSASVAAGEYATCLAEGLFKLGSVPSGTVTANVEGDASDGYIETTAQIVRWAIRNRTDISDPDDLDVASFADLDVLQPAPVNYWIGPDDDLKVSDFIANLMGGIGGWGGHRRDGRFEVRVFAAPTGDQVQSFSRSDMIGDIEKKPLPDGYNPPPHRWRVPYARSWEVQTDLAGGVGVDVKAFVGEPYRLATAERSAIKVDHPFAQDREPVQAYFTNDADAQDEADRLLDLHRQYRAIYSATLPRRALRLEVGDVCRLMHERFGLSAGKLMTVIEIDERFDFGSDGNVIDSVRVTFYG